MVIETKRMWWEAEISRLEVASQNMKWRIVDRRTDPSSRMGIQPVKVTGEYAFNDEEILHEMEEVHVKKHYVPKNVDKTVEEQVKSWVAEAKVVTEHDRSIDCEINPADICNADITAEEVKRTFHQCSNTPGPCRRQC